LLKLRQGVGADLDVPARREATRTGHCVVVLDALAACAVQDQIVVRSSASPVEHVAIRVLAKPGEIRSVIVIEDLHLKSPSCRADPGIRLGGGDGVEASTILRATPATSRKNRISSPAESQKYPAQSLGLPNADGRVTPK
jgi:hypothetical protein